MRFTTSNQNLPPLTLNQVLKKRPLLAKHLARQKVDMVFLHGSLAKNNLKKLSDIDVAALFKQDYDLKDIGKLVELLKKEFKRDDIDLAVLNTASPLLCMQVLKNGKLLYCRREQIFKNYRLRTIQRYLATSHLRNSFHKMVEEAVLRS